MDVDAKRPGGGVCSTRARGQGGGSQKLAKSCGRLLWMAPICNVVGCKTLPHIYVISINPQKHLKKNFTKHFHRSNQLLWAHSSCEICHQRETNRLNPGEHPANEEFNVRNSKV